jgi:hypothetical protein
MEECVSISGDCSDAEKLVDLATGRFGACGVPRGLPLPGSAYDGVSALPYCENWQVHPLNLLAWRIC